MAEIDPEAEDRDAHRAEPHGAEEQPMQHAGRPSTARRLWDGINDVVKSPLFVFLVGGSFVALLPKIEEWRLPPGEREARALEQQARTDAELVAPFLGNLNSNEPGKFRASAAALKTLELASSHSHDGHPSAIFLGVNGAIDAVTAQLWPQPTVTAQTSTTLEVVRVQAARAASGPPADLSRACVYIQVNKADPAKRNLAVALKAELDAKSILAPGIQSMPSSSIPNMTQVRYFNDDDRATAVALAAIVEGITEKEPGIAKPRLPAKLGTLEVWIGRD